MISKVSITYDDEKVCGYIEDNRHRMWLVASIEKDFSSKEIAQEILDLVAALNVPVTMSYAYEDDPT
jgi:hypothetical protein